jgi:uncharacterized protein with NRDE domain
MCFFAMLYRMFDEYPLIVAANRDEFLDRPGTPPFELRPGVLAGQDPRSGGTWLGVNRRGLIVAVTNRYEKGDRHPQTTAGAGPLFRSRGLLCLDLLELDRVSQVESALRGQFARHAYNEFNLIAADRENALAVTLAHGRLSISPLTPGLHIVANTLPDNKDDPKVTRGLSLMEAAGLSEINRDGPLTATDIDAILAKLRRVCADHGRNGTGGDNAICVHAPDRGTLSSTIIALHHNDPAKHRYFFADGNPCKTVFRELAID